MRVLTFSNGDKKRLQPLLGVALSVLRMISQTFENLECAPYPPYKVYIIYIFYSP